MAVWTQGHKLSEWVDFMLSIRLAERHNVVNVNETPPSLTVNFVEVKTARVTEAAIMN